MRPRQSCVSCVRILELFNDDERQWLDDDRQWLDDERQWPHDERQWPHDERQWLYDMRHRPKTSGASPQFSGERQTRYFSSARSWPNSFGSRS